MVVYGYGPFENDHVCVWESNLTDGWRKRKQRTPNRNPKRVLARLAHTLKVKLPDKPTGTPKWAHRRRKPYRERVANVTERKLPLVIEFLPEALEIRAAAWYVCAFDVVALKPQAIKRLRELLAWQEWIDVWKDPRKIRSAIRKQIRQLEGKRWEVSRET